MTAAESFELMRPGEVMPAPPRQMVAGALTIQEIIAQKKLVAQCVSELMKDGEHFGVIPGTSKRKDAEGKELPPKPSLLKPGADLLCSLFQLEADYSTEEAIREPTFIYYRLKCTLTSAATGIKRGSGLGSCNSREEKYVRAAAKKCPQCGKETIIKGRDEYGGGWLCYAKKGGCGAKFIDGAAEIEQQDTGVKDPSDLDNTILKMAAKRARIDAVLTVTGASDFFTQDVEELESREAGHAPPAKTDGNRVASNNPAGMGSPDRAPENGANRNATQTASSAGASGSRDGGERPASKPKANTIKHDGKRATADQVRLLQVLRGKLQIPDCKGPETCAQKYQEWSKTAGAPVDKVRYCTYHQQLQAFKDQKGLPIRSSKDLSAAQISNLIDRYQAKLATQAQRADERSQQAAADLGGMLDDNGTEQVLAAIKNTGASDVEVTEYILAPFGADTVAQLDRDDKPKALALVMALAKGTEAYIDTMERLGFPTEHLR